MSKRHLWCSCAIGTALLLICQSSVAQGTPGDWTRVQNLAVDTALFVKTKFGAKYHGELVSVTADLLDIDSDEPASQGRTILRREFRREDVTEIWLVAPAASLVAGAVIGAGAGAGIGIALDSTAKAHDYRGVVALVLGTLGAVIGAAIAHHHPFVKSRRVYVAP